ncbi:MAG: beta-propeller fold lactonase family protein [Acidobacteriota bacterium]|nr:beta-propeller fold lactonase family protein [Acidobacteriota bacterium]
MQRRGLVVGVVVFGLGMWSQAGAQRMDLPSSKQLVEPVPGAPQRINSLPVTMAVSPDKRYVVTVNTGYGTYESRYMESLAVLDTRTGHVTDFPDDRTLVQANQTLYSGLAFSADGTHLYATMGALKDPDGSAGQGLGNGIVVYRFTAGVLAPERLVPLPLAPLAAPRTTNLIGGTPGSRGVPFPAALATVQQQGREKLLVAENLADDAVLLDVASGHIDARFDLTEHDAVPSAYPIDVAVTHDGRRAFVALWNASEVAELDLAAGKVLRRLPLLKPRSPMAPGSHPCALALSADEHTLYVALSNRDAVAAVRLRDGAFALQGYLDTRLPGQSYFGAEPQALAVAPDGTRLYVANGATDSIAVFDPRQLTRKATARGMVEPLGFVPTEWFPTALALVSQPSGSRLYIATAKGRGTGPNNFAGRTTAETRNVENLTRSFTYIATLLHGSLAAVETSQIDAALPHWTSEVVDSNRMKAAAETLPFASGHNPIRHVIYIIKENRTYDQILGDLTQNGKPVGNGDPAMNMYGAAITPNLHKLALQFGVLDNFYDSGEVSGDGHVWSNAAIGTDYLERVWQEDYRSGARTYDYEGVVAEGYPIEQHIPDVSEPASGYLWGNLTRHGKSLFHFGEYISSTFCDVKKSGSSQEGPLLEGLHCPRPSVKPGERFPQEWGGEVSRYEWNVPLLAKNVATKPELQGHFAPDYPDFNVRLPDQIRVNVFERYLKGWVADRTAGHDTMPSFVMLRLGDDHTAGTGLGSPTPRSSIADNDLAVGRAVEAISHSPYWDDTAFFILEDDAQNGGDHVDAHRSIAFVISKYAPRAAGGGAFVDSRFYSTVSMVRTMETVLGLPPMNNNDAFSSMMGSLFSGPGDQAPYVADTTNRDNGLIYRANRPDAVGQKASSRMDFVHPDHADPAKLNVILWKDAMGDKPVPPMLTELHRKSRKDDDDD